MLSRWARAGNKTNEDDSVSPEGEIQKVAFKSREAEEGGHSPAFAPSLRSSSWPWMAAVFPLGFPASLLEGCL